MVNLFPTRYIIMDAKTCTGQNHRSIRAKELTCSICNKLSPRKHCLQRHSRLHDRDRTCLICGEWFAQNEELKEHHSIHDEELTCPNCKERFSTKGSLRRHSRERCGTPEKQKEKLEEYDLIHTCEFAFHQIDIH
ncbi:hypothetical protein V8C42DRAFT_336657 [Trichoderma barbatum]